MILFFTYVQVKGNFSSSNNTDQLKCFHGYLTYPVIWEKKTPSIIVVPASQNQHAQSLTAAAYHAVQNSEIDTVILISQGNERQFYGVALPLYIDKKYFYSLCVGFDCLENFAKNSVCNYYQVPFSHNKDLLQQLRFLDFYMKKIKIVPLIVGSISQQDADILADIIIAASSCKTLVVIHSDIAYYHNVIHQNPCDVSKNCKIYDCDENFVQMIQSIGLQKNNKIQSQMVSSVFTILFALLRKPYYKNLSSYFVGYVTSCSDIIPLESIESYGAFIFQRVEDDTYKNYIGYYEQLQLLKAARLELYNLFGKRSLRLPCMKSYEMLQPHGLFASLYLMTDHSIILRGSMGKVETKFSLFNMVCQMTKQAAYKDNRFYSLRYEEVCDTIISLSIVHDLQEIKNFESLEETQGIMLQYNGRQAVSLPFKIPTKAPVQPWSYESVLTKLSYQIKLHSCLWKKPEAKIFTFRSQAFQEE